MSKDSYVKFTKNNGVGYIEFYNPSHNALPSKMLSELSSTIENAGADKDCSILVLKSGGDRTFCAGASFDDLAAISTIEEGKAFFMGFANVINALRKNPKIVIGSIQGKAVGGGVGLAAAVDLCFASEYASIKLSELNIGIGPFVIEPALKRKLGLSVVSQLTLHPQTFFSAKIRQLDPSKKSLVSTYILIDQRVLLLNTSESSLGESGLLGHHILIL